VSLWLAAAAAQTPPAQKPEPRLSFEVASIKPAQPLDPDRIMAGQQHITANVDAARIEFMDVSIAELIRAAYRIRLYQISGPDWIVTTRFDVMAKLPEGATTEQVPEMLQALLAERFHLTYHNGSREMPVYALLVDKDGPKLKESDPDQANAAEKQPDPGGRGGRGVNPMTTSGPNGSSRMSAGPNGLRVELTNMTIPTMIDWLARFTDRPVVDQTGLTGRYDLGLDVSRDEMLNAARAAGMSVDAAPGRIPESASDPNAVSIFSSLHKVGLRLEQRRLPLTLLMVDHIEKTPTEN
jgi:uncharacterized protein (TIGR03435 family)